VNKALNDSYLPCIVVHCIINFTFFVLHITLILKPLSFASIMMHSKNNRLSDTPPSAAPAFDQEESCDSLGIGTQHPCQGRRLRSGNGMDLLVGGHDLFGLHEAAYVLIHDTLIFLQDLVGKAIQLGAHSDVRNGRSNEGLGYGLCGRGTQVGRTVVRG